MVRKTIHTQNVKRPVRLLLSKFLWCFGDRLMVRTLGMQSELNHYWIRRKEVVAPARYRFTNAEIVKPEKLNKAIIDVQKGKYGKGEFLIMPNFWDYEKHRPILGKCTQRIIVK